MVDRLPSVDGGMVEIEIGPLDFVQADAEINRLLIQWLIERCGADRRIVDLFSGCGNLSLPLATSGRTIIGADSNRAAVALANRSARTIGANARYLVVDLFRRFDPAEFTGADTLLLDPPRKGAKRIAAMMGRLLPRRLIMIHCDPASGGRDAEAVAARGYRLLALYTLDMFAWSGHLETVSLWERESPAAGSREREPTTRKSAPGSGAP